MGEIGEDLLTALFNGFYAAKHYPAHLRRIRYRDPETGGGKSGGGGKGGGGGGGGCLLIAWDFNNLELYHIWFQLFRCGVLLRCLTVYRQPRKFQSTIRPAENHRPVTLTLHPDVQVAADDQRTNTTWRGHMRRWGAAEA